LAFQGHFHELLPIVLGFRADLQGIWQSIHLREEWQKKLVVFAFMALFVSYCPQFWGFGVIYKAHDSQYMFERRGQKHVFFCVLGPFSWAIAHSFGVSEWFTRSMTLSTCLRGMAKN
jgi:hypothetical protein